MLDVHGRESPSALCFAKLPIPGDRVNSTVACFARTLVSGPCLCPVADALSGSPELQVIANESSKPIFGASWQAAFMDSE